MLKNLSTAKERWGGVNTLIDHLLNERQELLVIFCELASLDKFDEQDPQQAQQIRQFCQILVDYSSAGHFEVYNQLIKEGESFNDQAGVTEATAQIRHIEPTTDSILDFNDKYQETDDLITLTADLSSLGVALENRFSAEDIMIEALHSAHSEATDS